MLSFRYHIVSLVAVFLALSIGVIVGTTVIDRALVDRLEDQQRLLRDDIREAQETNRALSDELDELRERSDRLGSEGGERLVAGTLVDVPVVIIGVRGLEGGLHDRLGELVASAGADQRGTIWLTDRFALAEETHASSLAAVLDERSELPRSVLRNLAVIRLAAEVRSRASVEEVDERTDPWADGGGAGGTEDPDAAGPDDAEVAAGDGPGPSLLDQLVDAGFVEVERGPALGDEEPVVVPGTRVVVLAGSEAAVGNDVVANRLALELVASGRPEPPVALVAVEPTAAEPDDEAEEEGEEPPEPFVAQLRANEGLSGRLSTVDNLDQLSGRLATVLALEDLGVGTTGHYGTGPGADRLVPAPPAPPPDEG
jgi:hypothetical protein